MRLVECLNDADVATLRKIADHYGFACSRHSKMEMIQEILLSFRNPRFLSECLETWLDGREFSMLRLCLAAARPLTEEEVAGFFSDWEVAVVETAVREGWLYATTRIDGRRLYLLPDELREALQERLIRHVMQAVRQQETGPVIYAEEGYALSHDLDVFLEFVDHHDILLTQGGAMYKRHLQQVLHLLEVEEAPLSGGWRFGYGRRFHDYPDRFALIYDFAYHAGLIEEGAEGRLRTRPEREKWLAMGQLERQRALLRFYLSLYRRPITRLPLLTQVIGRAQPGWIHSDSMFQALEPLINEYYYDTKEQVWRTRIIKMLTHLGILRTGDDDVGERWFQITKLGQELLTPDAISVSEPRGGDDQRVLIVQPNFDILVTAENPRLTAILAQFSDLGQSGALRVYRMSRNSLQHGIREGGAISGWLEFLTKYSQTPVPGNVERTLRELEQSLQDGGVDEGRSLGS
ncbi:helicase-associated domain-containing protein [Alicyclobacillus herbarius]|uniref:helicase-associated domain-containing protein n=1 Tax=Alicyclobacillus herbarius TaxID=122960 RepID=UPI0004092802|nr:helicase-associated domain-containing protein [Alicyclobacillus herbarius]